MISVLQLIENFKTLKIVQILFENMNTFVVECACLVFKLGIISAFRFKNDKLYKFSR